MWGIRYLRSGEKKRGITVVARGNTILTSNEKVYKGEFLPLLREESSFQEIFGTRMPQIPSTPFVKMKPVGKSREGRFVDMLYFSVDYWDDIEAIMEELKGHSKDKCVCLNVNYCK